MKRLPIGIIFSLLLHGMLLAMAPDFSSSPKVSVKSPKPLKMTIQSVMPEEPVPTEIPTQEPKPEPTPEPTPKPTEKPTPKPTKKPTKKPTPVPTKNEVTPKPTPAATEEPTPEKTEVIEPPKNKPTDKPTQKPIVEKPVPWVKTADYKSNPAPDYPRSARRNRYEGTVILWVEVSQEGLAVQVRVHKSSGHKILDREALEAVQQWQFTPALRDGETIAGEVLVPVRFQLK